MIDLSTALIRDALTNAWANPAQDRQVLIKPKQVTSARGTIGAYRTPYSSYPVPDTTHRWMLYEYGQLPPRFIGLDLDNSVWRSLKEVMSQEDVIAFPMIRHRMLMTSTVKVIRLNNNNLLFAVEMASNAALMKTDTDLYVRFYSNAFFSTVEGSAYGGIETDGIFATDGTEAAALLSVYNTSGYANSGTTWWFKNGYLTDKPTVNDIAIGDNLQYIWDSSGIQYYDVQLKNLTSFTSIKDQVSKLLLVTPGYVDTDLVFYDDIEIFLYSVDLNGKKKGCYYDRQRVSDLSQVTYRDWSLDGTRLSEVILEQNGEINYSSAFVRVYLRKTVAITTDIGDGSYLGDFYNIDAADRYRILTGSYGSLTRWKAAELENSPFMKWLGSVGTALTEEDVHQVYNYYGLQRAVQLPVKNAGAWILPEMAKQGCLVVNLDSNGEYLSQQVYTEASFGIGVHTPVGDVADILVYCGNLITTPVAMDLPVVLGNDIPGIFDEERFYYVGATQQWVIATQGADYTYTASTGAIEWSSTHNSTSKLKRSAGHYTHRELTIPYSSLCTPIDIFANGTLPSSKHDFGRVDVWIDNQRAVPGLDYFVDGFKLYLTTKEYIDLETDVDSNPQLAHVRFIAHGLPKDSEAGQYGFVVEGMVNHDNDIDLVKNRNQTLFINGRKTDVSQVWLAEDYRGEYAVRFSTGTLVSWREGTEYVEYTPVVYDRVLYVAPLGGVGATQVFDETLWLRVWELSHFTYDDNGVTRHVKIHAGKDTVLVRSVAVDGIEEEPDTFIPLALGADYQLTPGLPLSAPPANASTYQFTSTANVISRFVAQTLAENEADSRTMTSTISAYLEALSPSYELKGPINIPRQHRVVSPFISALTKAIQAGEINLTSADLSEAAVDFLTRDYQYLFHYDPVYDDTQNHDFITGYGHCELEAIALPARAVNFLAKCSEYFFDGRIQINRDFTIA